MKTDEQLKEEIINKFNNFIQKWCGSSYPHLIDTDENDGEEFRDDLRSIISKGYISKEEHEKEMELLKFQTENRLVAFDIKSKELEEAKVNQAILESAYSDRIKELSNFKSEVITKIDELIKNAVEAMLNESTGELANVVKVSDIEDLKKSIGGK